MGDKTVSPLRPSLAPFWGALGFLCVAAPQLDQAVDAEAAGMPNGFGGAIITAAGENDVDYVCRFFAASEGIDEDPCCR